jgi:serine/threonine-protein kinase
MLAGTFALVALAAIVFGLKEFSRRASVAEVEPVRFAVTPVGDERINSDMIAISLDGTRLVYVGSDKTSSRLYLRNLSELDTRPVGGSDRAEEPFFSPDGKWLAFFSEGELKRVPVNGGSPMTIATNMAARPAMWTKDNRIILPTQAITRRRSGLSEVVLSEGRTRPIMYSDTLSGENLTYPMLVADGKTLLLESFGPKGTEDDKLALASPGSDEYTVLDFRAVKPLGYLDGYIICLRWDVDKGTIIALPVDLRAKKITGDPIELQANVSSVYGASLSQNGTLAFVSGGSRAQLVTEDRKGKIDTLLSEPRDYENPRYSPDGTRIAFAHSGTINTDLAVYDIPRRMLSRLTTGTGENPQWYADGKRVLFDRATTATAGLLWEPADGSALSEPLHPKLPPGVSTPFNPALSPDQTTIAFVALGGSQRSNIYYFKPGIDDVAHAWVATPFDDFAPRFSPDGKWIVYVSDDSGRYEVFVRPFPGPGPRTQISSGGGTEPVWSRDGRHVYYRNGLRLIEADVTLGAAISLGSRRPAFLLTSVPAENARRTGPSYDLSPDGQRIVFAQPTGSEAKLIVIVNWFTEVRRKLRAH